MCFSFHQPDAIKAAKAEPTAAMLQYWSRTEAVMSLSSFEERQIPQKNTTLAQILWPTVTYTVRTFNTRVHRLRNTELCQEQMPSQLRGALLFSSADNVYQGPATVVGSRRPTRRKSRRQPPTWLLLRHRSIWMLPQRMRPTKQCAQGVDGSPPS